MKKLFYLIVLALILGLVLTGCLLSNVGQVPVTEQSGITYLTKNTEQYPFVTDLIADGRDSAIDVGDVLVWNDGDDLYVKYLITEPGWCLTETHLHVAESLELIPQKNGNPIPGKFEYKDEHNCITVYTHEIPLVWSIDVPLCIAAHAKVQNDTVPVGWDSEGNPISYWTETGWGAGFEFPGKNWATYFSYTVQPPFTLNLYEKNTTTWIKVPDGAEGELEYYPYGYTFDFIFNGHGLEPSWDYTLIYYPDPWNAKKLCLGTATADGWGSVYIAGSEDTGDLPMLDDWNADPSKTTYADGSTGAKIWLVPSASINCSTGAIVFWNMSEYLFEEELITFDDIDG